MGSLSGSPLGADTAYPETYAPDVLYSVERQAQRDALGLNNGWPWSGTDRWLAFEVSWLTPTGVPAFALATLDVPVSSPFLVESKSLKLYLNSFNMTRFGDGDEVQRCVERDLSAAVGQPVEFRLYAPAQWAFDMPGAIRTGTCLDNLPLQNPVYDIAPACLRYAQPHHTRRETLYSHVLRSNCPVTGQPDWGTVIVEYEGTALSHEGLLAYLVSFRHHTGFHEHCVERIFTDLMALGTFDTLNVWALYARRGGLAINPWRSLTRAAVPAGVMPWQ